MVIRHWSLNEVADWSLYGRVQKPPGHSSKKNFTSRSFAVVSGCPQFGGVISNVGLCSTTHQKRYQNRCRNMKFYKQKCTRTHQPKQNCNRTRASGRIVNFAIRWMPAFFFQLRLPLMHQHAPRNACRRTDRRPPSLSPRLGGQNAAQTFGK